MREELHARLGVLVCVDCVASVGLLEVFGGFYDGVEVREVLELAPFLAGRVQGDLAHRGRVGGEERMRIGKFGEGVFGGSGVGGGALG